MHDTSPQVVFPLRLWMFLRVLTRLLELNAKPISKPPIQRVLEIYCGASNANL